MPVCPKCDSKISAKLALKSTDVLLFPQERPARCPSCNAALVPVTGSVLLAAGIFLLLLGAFAIYFLRFSGGSLAGGVVEGLVAGLVVGLGGIFGLARLIRFRPNADDRTVSNALSPS